MYETLDVHPRFLVGSVLLLKFFVLSYYVSCVVMSIMTSAYKWCSVRLSLHLFVRWLMSYLRYLCFLVHSGVQHILGCVFILFFLVLCTLCCQFLWIVFLRLVYPMLPVSLDCPFLIAGSVFFNVYLPLKCSMLI